MRSVRVCEGGGCAQYSLRFWRAGWFPELVRDAPAGDAQPPNQVMKFGQDVVRSAWLKRLMLDVMETTTTFPPSIRCRVPGFDQAIINFYRVGEGIKQHVDLAKYGSQRNVGMTSASSTQVVYIAQVRGRNSVCFTVCPSGFQ